MAEPEIRIGGGDTAAPLNLAKRMRLLQDLTGPLEGRCVLDCGCGAGEYVRALSACGASAYGIEYQVSKLFSRPRGDGVSNLAAADIQRLPVPNDRFEIAVLNEVLEHVPDDLEALRGVYRVLRPGGTVVVLSPNRLYPFETHGTFLRRSGRRLPPYVPLVPYLPLRLGRLWLDYWARNYWPRELRRLIERAGFQVVARAYVWQTFENISGHQPALLRQASSGLRAIAGFLERVPGLRAFGVSQAIVARRPDDVSAVD